jgi:PAS domain S-box-containing protein
MDDEPPRPSEAMPAKALTAPFFKIRGLLLALVFVASLPLLVLMAFNIRNQVQTARAAAFDQALSRAKVLTNVIDSQIGSIDTLLRSLAHQISPDPSAYAQNEALLKAVKADLPPIYYNLKAYAADGRSLGSSSGSRESVNKERRYFAEAMAGAGLAVGDPVDVDNVGRWSITLARPLLNREGRPMGLVGATISLAKLQELLDTVALPKNSVITLLNEKSIVLARTLEPAKWVGRNAKTRANFIQDMRRRSGTDEQVTLDGTVRLGGFATCERVTWNIYVGVPQEEAFIEVRAASRRAYLLGGGTLLCVVILAWFMANRITRPISKLEADAKAFADGDFSRRAQVDTKTEIGNLAESFNSMLNGLEARDAALRTSEARYRSLIDNAPEAIVVLDASSGRFVDSNPRAEALFGLEVAAIREIDVVLVSPVRQPDGRSSFEQARFYIQEAMQGRTPVFEWWHRDSGGREFPCEVRLLRLPHDGRELIRGSITEITERKQAERQLRETLNLQRTILNSASHAIISSSADGVITLFNPAAELLLGYQASELVGRRTPEVIHDPAEVASRAAAISTERGRTVRLGFDVVTARAQRGLSSSEEWTYIRKDGGRVPVNLVVSALRDEGGGIRGFLCMATDITARRQAEQQLAHERTVMELLARGVLLNDVLTQLVLGHEDLFPGTIGSVVLLDPTGRKLCSAVAPHLPIEFYQAINGTEIGPAAGSCGSAIFTNTTVIAEDIASDRHWQEYGRFALAHGLQACWSTPIRSTHGVVMGAFALYYREPRRPQPAELAAITSSSQLAALAIERSQADAARINLERKLQETQKLESLGVLAGGIAHDFNNLLTGILGNSSLASLELTEGSPIQEYLGQINQASLRAADLCKQMLAYSGRGRFVVQKLDLNHLVEETTHLLQISISKQAVLRFNLGKGLPTIEADATQIRQVVMNLVINASEAIGEKSGVISISTGLTRIDHAYLGGTIAAPDIPEGEYVSLEISDNGSGMSADTRAKIFDPFFSTKFTGRGLGLAAVLGIMRGHKGALKVYSELGRGTTFKLLFPCATGPAETAASVATARPAWRGKGVVLVADDEETIRTTTARMLRALGFDTALVANGREAVDAFRDNPGAYALVLLDLTMPHMDGEQAFTELRRLQPDVRVVLMSGFNRQEAVARFTGKGLASFLQKPFSMEALTEVMQNVLATGGK